ncbi:MAG: STAS domain-containing protein [Acidobacteriota bacterium]
MAEKRWAGLGEILLDKEKSILKTWVQEQDRIGTLRPDLMSEADLAQEGAEFLRLLGRGMAAAQSEDLGDPAWEPLRVFLEKVSRDRGRRGFGPSETAGFVFALRRVLLEELKGSKEAEARSMEVVSAGIMSLLDRLGLLTFEHYLKGREEIIARQQQELLELSTPVVKLWDGILGLPLIGTLDSARTQVVMESLLMKIVETGSEVAIIDITGVPTVDTLVAQHLIKTVAAARLMGAECIISGIRPQIAQTIVHLGINLSDVPTKSTLADAFRLALARIGGGPRPQKEG